MTVLEDGSVLYATYGTLRKGYGNHRLLEGDRAEFLGTIQTPPNYTMYSLGGFPGVTEKGNTPITVEIYRTTDKSVMNSVNGLEGYTGIRNHERNWYDTCDIQTEWGVANMFTMNQIEESDSKPDVVETGDWNNRVNSKN